MLSDISRELISLTGSKQKPFSILRRFSRHLSGNTSFCPDTLRAQVRDWVLSRTGGIAVYDYTWLPKRFTLSAPGLESIPNPLDGWGENVHHIPVQGIPIYMLATANAASELYLLDCHFEHHHSDHPRNTGMGLRLISAMDRVVGIHKLRTVGSETDTRALDNALILGVVAYNLAVELGTCSPVIDPGIWALGPACPDDEIDH